VCRYCEVDDGVNDGSVVTAGLKVHAAYQMAALKLRQLEAELARYAGQLPAELRPSTMDFLKDVVKVRRRLNKRYAAYRPGEAAERPRREQVVRGRPFPEDFSLVTKGDLYTAREPGRYFQRTGPMTMEPGVTYVVDGSPAVYEMRILAVSPRRGLVRYSSRAVWPDGTSETLKRKRTTSLALLVDEIGAGHLARTFEGD
jgi:hypothetical protein